MARARAWRAGAGPKDGQALTIDVDASTTIESVQPRLAERLGALVLPKVDGAGAVRAPRVRDLGRNDDHAWLVLEWLELGRRDETSDRRLGEELAALHASTGESFGWPRDNFIGLTPQPNTETPDWAGFFVQERLVFQLELLARSIGNHRGGDWTRRVEPAATACERDLAGHHPEPSLIHGDLWSGNASALKDGTPVIYDPAVHYADRECDLAMAELFGGFSPGFREGYQSAWPLPAGFERRMAWYQLYHVLNHACLFGGGYLSDARCRLRSLV